MKFTIHKTQLSSALAAVNRAVATRPTMPVLSNILISAGEDGICLTATNLEMTLKLHADAHVDVPGDVTLPARTLLDLVSTLPGDNITVALTEKTMTAAVTCRQSKTNIKGIDARDFPDIQLPAGNAVTIPGIREMIDQVEFAASLDEGRPVLCGVNLTITGTRLRMAATDGFRISLREAELPDPANQPVNIVVPARSLEEFSRVCNGSAALSVHDAHAVFTSGGIALTTLLIDGNFPDFEQIIPKTYTTTVELSTVELSTAARQAEIIARDGNYGMILDIRPADGLITVSAQSDDGSMQTELQASVTGQPLRLMVNINYLKDFLSVVKTPSITLQCNRPNTPMMFRPSDGAFDHIIMPMVLSQ